MQLWQFGDIRVSSFFIRSDKLKALLLVVGYPRLEQNRIGSVLRVQQRRVAEHLREEVYALVALLEVCVVL